MALRSTGHIDTEMIEVFIIFGGDQGIDEVLRDFPVFQILAVNPLEQDANFGCSVTVVDRTFPAEDSGNRRLIHLRTGRNGHQIVQPGYSGQPSEKRTEQESDKTVFKKFQHNVDEFAVVACSGRQPVKEVHQFTGVAYHWS